MSGPDVCGEPSVPEAGESSIVLLDPKQLLSICLVSQGQVIWQCECPPAGNEHATEWNQVVNGIWGRLGMKSL